MPGHLEFIEGCALCLPHGNSAFSVACDLLYITKTLFFSLSLWFKYNPYTLGVIISGPTVTG